MASQGWSVPDVLRDIGEFLCLCLTSLWRIWCCVSKHRLFSSTPLFQGDNRSLNRTHKFLGESESRFSHLPGKKRTSTLKSVLSPLLVTIEQPAANYTPFQWFLHLAERIAISLSSVSKYFFSFGKLKAHRPWPAGFPWCFCSHFHSRWPWQR